VDLGAWAVVAVLGAVLAGATTNRLTGLGFSLVASPVLLQVLGPRDGVRLLNMISVAVTLTNVVVSWRDVRRADVLRLGIPAMLVTPLFAWSARRMDEEVLLVGAGVLTIASAVILGRGLRFRRLEGTGGAIGAGVVSAGMNVVSGLSGPAVAMVGLNGGWPPEQFRATLQLYFLVLNAVAVASLGPVNPGGGLGAGIAIGVVGGLWLGARLSGHVPVEAWRRMVLVIVVIGGTVAIARGLG
jgi:uncharacterized protein